MYEQRECPYSSWACMADMYLGGLLFLQQVNSCLYSVHIHSMRHGFLLQRTYPFDAPRLSTGFALTARHFFQTPKKYPKRLAPAYGLRCAQVSLAPVPLRGHAVTGHPWPNTALPASMPEDPLRRTSTRPPEGAGRSRADQKPKPKQSKAEQSRAKQSKAKQSRAEQ